jgi:hypothetical protein
MKSMIAAVVGLAGLAAAANAAWGLKYEVSNNGGATWSSSVIAAPGDVIKIRFGAYFDAGTSITTGDGTGNALALNRFTGSNQVTNLGAGDMLQNAVRTSSSGNPALTQIAGGTIGTTAVTSFGGQLLLDLSGFVGNPQTYYQIMTAEVKVVSGTVRTMVWQNKTFGSGNTKGLTFYHDASLANKQSDAPNSSAPSRSDMVAEIRVIPTPASMALIGLGGLVAARRRRA